MPNKPAFGQPDRRQVLAQLGAAACLPLVGCAGDKTAVDDSAISTDDSSADSPIDSPADSWIDDGECAQIPEETAGPYPGDGSNGPNVLTLDGIVRSDIRSSVGALSGTAEGVALTLRLRLLNSDGCTPLVGYAVYVWHCDRDGNYSLYTRADQNWLRGVQVSDADGVVSFQSIFPGCYSGRWPHVHFEVYPTLDATASASNALLTSQLGLPAAACEAAYATSGYSTSKRNFEALTLESDSVFGDGYDTQIAAVRGDVNAGFEAALEVGVGV